MARVKTAVLISGRGSNMQALIDAAKDPAYPAEIVRVISNAPEAGGLERAAEAGIATTAIDHRNFEGRAPFEDALHAELVSAGVELVCLAGFMRLLTAAFVGAGQMLFGTDDPFIDADRGHVERLDLPETDKARILGENAAALLGL